MFGARVTKNILWATKKPPHRLNLLLSLLKCLRLNCLLNCFCLESSVVDSAYCNPAKLITDKMIHSKLMLIDDETVIAGSANFSVFSMQKAVELDLVVHGLPGLVEDVRQEAQRRIDDSQRVESAADLKKYNRVLASLQQLHQWLS